MSGKYIEADALIKSLATETGCMDRVFHAMDVADMVKNFPAADVRENVRGEWEIMEDADGCTYYRCSACHRYRFHNGAMLKKYCFCPICGADNRPNKRARI